MTDELGPSTLTNPPSLITRLHFSKTWQEQEVAAVNV